MNMTDISFNCERDSQQIKYMQHKQSVIYLLLDHWRSKRSKLTIHPDDQGYLLPTVMAIYVGLTPFICEED